MLACGPRPSGKPYVASCTGCVRLIVDPHGNASGVGHDLVQKGKSLRDDLMDEEIDACHVTARPIDAGNQAELDRIVPDPEQDRDRRGRSFGGSPRKTSPIRCGMRRCLMTSLAATASGGATIAPRAIAAAIGKPPARPPASLSLERSREGMTPKSIGVPLNPDTNALAKNPE